MIEMYLMSSAEDFYVFAQKEEKFKELVDKVPARYENADMYSVSIIQKRPDWIHNRAVIDFKFDGNNFHGQYLMGWFIDKPNVEGLAKVAADYINKFLETPKNERDVAEAFSDANSDNVLNHFFEIAGIEVDD